MFYLWEEGVSEEDKYKNPKYARVDKNGVAEVTFSWSEYATTKTRMIFLSSKSASKTFFVTAEYDSKKKDNKTGVDVTKLDLGKSEVIDNAASSVGKTGDKKSDNSSTFQEILSKIKEIVVEGPIFGFDFGFDKKKTAASVGWSETEKKEEEEKVCECEARVRAFIRMIRKGEGTIDEERYSRIAGGSSFKDHGKDFTTHPKIYIAKHNSTAAGSYQITKTNWNDDAFVNWRNKNNVTNFTPESQDLYAVHLVINKKKAFEKIKNNDFRGAVTKCQTEWASLPGAGYGQREEKIESIEKLYKKFLKQEIEGEESNEAKLHIKPGFLKKYFQINCCENNFEIKKEKNSKEYNVEKAIAKLNSSYESNSISKCAKYVRIAIEAGGLSTEGRPLSAKNYDKFLPKLGFSEVNTSSYNPIRSDIAVIQSIPGHPHGHICMFNGSEWISDFKQRDMWPGSGYRRNPPRYNIFRWN